MRTLGRRFGSKLNLLKEVLNDLDGRAAVKSLNETGALTVKVDGIEEVLAKEDLLIETAEMDGFVSEADNGITVVLDTNLTPELIEEGFVRELISKVQTMRKDSDFEVTDHIRLYQDGNAVLKEVIQRNAEQIKSEILADEIYLGEMRGHTAEWNINGEAVVLGVTKVTI